MVSMYSCTHWLFHAECGGVLTVYNCLVGTRGRTAPQRLDRRLEEEEDDADLFGLSRTAYGAPDSDTDHYVINTEPVCSSSSSSSSSVCVCVCVC